LSLPASATTNFSKGTEKKLLATIAMPIEARSSTVDSHTIVATGRMNAQATRATHSVRQAMPHTTEKPRSSARKRGDVAASQPS